MYPIGFIQTDPQSGYRFSTFRSAYSYWYSKARYFALTTDIPLPAAPIFINAGGRALPMRPHRDARVRWYAREAQVALWRYAIRQISQQIGRR